jgi:hypothetical protein
VLLFLFEKIFQDGKGVVQSRGVACILFPQSLVGIGYLLAGVLVFVAVKTEQLPVAAVRRIVFVVVVPVVDGELLEAFAGEFPAAAATDVGIDLEGLFAIALLTPLSFPTGFGENVGQFSRVLFRHVW